MTHLVVVIFPDEARAAAGMRALQELGDERRIALGEMAVVAKGADGRAAVKGQGLPGTGIGALIGGLVGMLGGPVGAALGAASGAWVGTWRDLSHLGLETEFAERVRRELARGEAAVVASLPEEPDPALEARMAALGGIVVHGTEAEIEESHIAQQAAAHKTELDALRAGGGAAGPREPRTRERIARIEAGLEDVGRRAARRLDALRQESDGRIAELERQAASAAPDTRARIEQQLAAAKAARDRRAALLEQAIGLTREALS
ncbi:MAG TPA: DUF1269 domain-containing protein [Gammaproteobacteria bacterium]